MLVFVRHGETVRNRDAIAQGKFDGGLTDRGLAQAHHAARAISRLGPVLELHASDAVRASETAEILGGVLGLVPNVSPFLRERDLAGFDGLSRDALTLRRRDAGLRLDDIWQDWDGVAGVESDHAVHERVRVWLDETGVERRAVDHHVAIVTHGGVLKSLLRCAITDSRTGTGRIYLGLGCIVTIWLDECGWHLEGLHNPRDDARLAGD